MEVHQNILDPLSTPGGHFNTNFIDYWKKSLYHHRCGPTKDYHEVNEDAFQMMDKSKTITAEKFHQIPAPQKSPSSSTEINLRQSDMQIVPNKDPTITTTRDIKLDNLITQNGRQLTHLEMHEDSYVWSIPKMEEEKTPTITITTEPVTSLSVILKPSSATTTKPIGNSWITPRQYLMERGSHLTNLVIGDRQRFHLKPTDEIYLPALKTISWHAPIHTDDDFDPTKDAMAFWQKRRSIHKILRSAPNLQVIKDFQFDSDIDLVLATKKVHTIHRLLLFDTVNVDNLLRFVEAKPKIQILQLIDTYPKIPPATTTPQSSVTPETEERREKLAKAIKKLFHSTWDTLRLLDLSQFCSSLGLDLQFPHKLPKLFQLTLGSVVVVARENGAILENFRPQPSRLFPVHIKLNKIFPSLVVLDCSRLQSDKISNWDLYFPSDYKQEFYGQLTSVKVLVINDQCTHYWLAKLGTVLCPNFTKLVVHSCHTDGENYYENGGGKRVDTTGLNYMLFKIFKYLHHLEHLELRILDFSLEKMSSSSCCLDSAFTGLSFESCRRLRVFGPAANPDDEVMMTMALGERTAQEEVGHLPGPSISNLKYLKTLVIKLGHNCLEKLANYTQDEDNPMPLFSFVCGRYGFGYLPELKVDIVFDHQCPWGKEIMKRKFNLLIPYVTLRHEEDRVCDHNDFVVYEKNF